MASDFRFESNLSRHHARAIAQGRLGPQSMTSGYIEDEEGRKGFALHADDGNFTGQGRTNVRWSVDPANVAHGTSDSLFADDEEHDRDAPVSVVHGRRASFGASIRINDPSALRFEGAHIPRQEASLPRYGRDVFHNTDEETARAVLERVQKGRHGLLMSEWGDSGPGIYVFGSRERGYGNSTIEGRADIGRSPEELSDRGDRRMAIAAEEEMRATNSLLPAAKVARQKQLRDVLVARGVSRLSAPDGAVLLHPSQFNATRVVTPSESVDVTPQRFRDGDPIWAPRTHGH